MGEEVKAAIVPGGMITDVSANSLGKIQHQEVKNLRLVKENEWESVRGLVNVITGFTNLKAGIEVTDDLSGDRFIIVQDVTSLKRITFHQGDGNGYENETPVVLTLPSGITIGASTVCRFFVHNGIVRITGPEDASGKKVPLWYGYVKGRTLFTNAWKEIYLGDFETDTESWTGNDATISQYDNSTDPDLLVGYAPSGHHSLKVAQTGAGGGARKSFTVSNGKKCRVALTFFRPSDGGTYDVTIKIGKTAGGSEYQTIVSTGHNGYWWTDFSTEFLTSSATLYVELIPSASGNNRVALLDYVFVEENAAHVVVDGWYLKKARLDPKTLSIEEIHHIYNPFEDSEIYTLFGKVSTIYDKSQYSLPSAMTRHFTLPLSMPDVKMTDFDFEIYRKNEVADYGSLDVVVKEADVDERVTGFVFGFKEYKKTDVAPSKPEEVPLSVQEVLDLTEDHPPYNYQKMDSAKSIWVYYNHTAAKNALELTMDGTYDCRGMPGDALAIRPGNRIKVYSDYGEELLHAIVVGNEASEPDNRHRIFLTMPVYPNLVATDASYWMKVTIIVERKWRYSTADAGWRTPVLVNAAERVYDLWEFIDMPAGTLNNTPQYSHHQVVGEKAYALSLEDEEEDVARYSPDLQFDNFPAGHAIQTPAGDQDRNLAIVNRDDRLVILKKKFFSQWHHAAGAPQQDIAIPGRGLFAEYGYIVIDGILFLVEEDDVYQFTGMAPKPVMQNHRLRSYYAQYRNANTFLAYNKLDRELWILMNGRILVLQLDYMKWYVRETDITPVCAFLSFDNELYVLHATKIVNYNHGQTTFGENIDYFVKSRLIDDQTPDAWKKVKRAELYAKASSAITLTVYDPVTKAGGETDWSESMVPATDAFKLKKAFPRKTGKSFEMLIEPTVPGNQLHHHIREIDLYLHRRWL